MMDAQKAAADEIVKASASSRVPVEGGSMGAAWLDVAAVSVRGAAHRRPRLGDVVLARTATGRIAHRVVWIRRRGGSGRLLTLGDGNRHCDAWLEEGDVLGVVACAISRAGRERKVRRLLPLLRAWLRLLPRQAGR